MILILRCISTRIKRLTLSYAIILLNANLCFNNVSAQYVMAISPADGAISNDTRSTDNPLISHSGDLSIPKPTTIQWHFTEPSSIVPVDLYLSEDSLFSESDRIATNYTDTILPVYNLKIDQQYYWQITNKNSSGDVIKSNVFTFKTPALWPRMIFIEGSTNVRDIGGRASMDGKMIKQGLFFRSGEMNVNYVITERGIKQALDLGVRCDIDLRYDSDNAHAALSPPVRYFHPQSEIGGLSPYKIGLQNFGDQYRDVFKELARLENYPVICHCVAGADRTGTVVALLEAVLNFSYEQIALDYRWTSLSINGVRDTMLNDWKEMVAEIKSYDTTGSTLQTGAVNYLKAKGVTPEEIYNIRAIFTGAALLSCQRIVTHAPQIVKQIRLYNTIQDRALPDNKCQIYTLSGRQLRSFPLDQTTKSMTHTIFITGNK